MGLELTTKQYKQPANSLSREIPVNRKKNLDQNINPWSFSKSICKPKESRNAPSFSQFDCQTYYSKIFSSDDCSYKQLPTWVAEVCPNSNHNHHVKFNLTAIIPGCIKKTLQKCSSSSAPGDDGITYHHLKKITSTHHFLATLFSKILLFSHSPPSSWCSAKTILIHKKGDPSKPSNFRPIALSSCVGKLFHKILARRLDTYLLANHIIDTSLQKG